MSTLSLLDTTSSGQCTVVGKPSIYNADEAHLGSTLKLRYELESHEDAVAWEEVFPGLAEKWEAVQDPECTQKWPGDKCVFIGGRTVRWTIKQARNGDAGISELPATVLEAVAKITHGGTFIDLRVRFEGLNPSDLTDLVALLRGTLDSTFATGQQEMFPDEKSAA